MFEIKLQMTKFKLPETQKGPESNPNPFIVPLFSRSLLQFLNSCSL